MISRADDRATDSSKSDDLEDVEEESEPGVSTHGTHAEDTTTDDGNVESIEERDEVKEIERSALQATRTVRRWRLGAMAALLVTACAVTFASYQFLSNDETSDVEKAFEQFSRALEKEIVEQQVHLRQNLNTFATMLSNNARDTHQNWPFVTLSRFEEYGANFIKQARIDIITTFIRVTEEEKHEYVNYTSANRKVWVQEGHMIQRGSLERLQDPFGNETFHPFISRATSDSESVVRDDTREVYWPSWQYSPPPATYGYINNNIFSDPDYAAVIEALLELKNETLTTPVCRHTCIPSAMTSEEHGLLHSKLAQSSIDYPHSFALHPVHRVASDYTSDIVGIVGTAFGWDQLLANLLPVGVTGINARLKNNCNQSYTFAIEGPDAIFLGIDDLHDPKYSAMGLRVNLSPHTHPTFDSTPGHCQFSMYIYPTSAFAMSYETMMPVTYATVVAITFIVIAIFFFGYDLFVQKLNQKLIRTAANANAVVGSIIPEHLRRRLLEQEDQPQQKKKGDDFTHHLDKGPGVEGMEITTSTSSRHMADLFLETTVLFADICGFTAWSSIREPIHVFGLLETIFQAFDQIAKRRRVFKVETMGDCYVAVSGLPEPQADHAILMVRFGRDIIAKMRMLTRALETKLGPDTGDLALRCGLHSGPVTGGVLRGDRSRFQLFGATMNTVAVIESLGRSGCLHCSKETAELIKAAGRDGWLEKRTDTVVAKGLGVIETYWVSIHRERSGSITTSVTSGNSNGDCLTSPSPAQKLPGLDEKTLRLIDWNVEILIKLMKQIVARREAIRKTSIVPSLSWPSEGPGDEMYVMPLEEVKEIITLPELGDEKTAMMQMERDNEEIKIPEKVTKQLHYFVSTIATMYKSNPFHNFGHASHVVMSVTKLMSRIVAPSHLDEMEDKENSAKSLHDHTYGITSDPLTQFACVFSALIHDVDHQGVSNAQLLKEDAPVAHKYKGRSVAEQNSLDLSWALLMRPQYKELRAFVFPRKAELLRFRQLVVNSIMATDIADKDLKDLRNSRWDKAFKKGDSANHAIATESKRDEVNRKATIVIEHIIQASDVSHTMQHWQVYQKWNQRLFEELYVAYLAGRMENDPSTFWYKGEFGFFDFYIIPLTRKLKECGVFGVSSDEYLQYALANRAEWEARGEGMVANMSKECCTKYGVKKNIAPRIVEYEV